MEQIMNKLVRDNIPQIIENNNEIAETRILSDEEYFYELNKKLLEECNEVVQASTKEERLEELADLLEVMKALAKIDNYQLETIELMAKQKAQKRGAFDKKIYLVKTITKTNN